MKTVYLGGPIAGTSYEEATDWREEVASLLPPGIVAINPMRMKEWASKYKRIPRDYTSLASTKEKDYLLTGEPHAIAARDFYDVANADMVLAYLPRHLSERRPSFGTLVEIGWATAQRVPVVLVTEDKRLVDHPLVRTHVGWIVPDLDVGVQAVVSVLAPFAAVPERQLEVG